MDTNHPAAHWEPQPPPPGAPPSNHYNSQPQHTHHPYPTPPPHPHYNNQPHPNFSNRPNAPAFYWPDARKRKFNHNPNRRPPPSFESSAKLYVSQLPRTSTEEDIRSIFGQHGKILEVVILKDKRTGQQQGTCFVKFATVGDAEAAIGALHNQHIYPGEAESLKVKFADGEQERLGIHGLKLYVKNYSKQATKKEIEELFSEFGDVEDVHILFDELRLSRGAGFVKFSNRSMAEAAINALNGTYFMRDCEHPLIVRFADMKKPLNVDFRCNVPSTHGINGGQFFPHNVQQGQATNYGAPVTLQIHPTNPSPRVVPPVAHKQLQPAVVAASLSHCEQQSSLLKPTAGSYTSKTLHESSQPSPQILEMHTNGNGLALQLNEEQVNQHQKSEDQLISPVLNEDLTLEHQPRLGKSKLPQQNTDQDLSEQSSGANSKSHKVVSATDGETIEPITQSASVISSGLDAISSLDCDWSEHFCPDGSKYYYNSETCESRWEKPAEYISFEKHVLQLIQNETSYSASQSLSSQEDLSFH